MLSVYFQHEFSALRALVAGHIIVTELSVALADFPDQRLGVVLDPHA